MNQRATWSLSDWLTYCESIHHTAIDMGLERVATVANRLIAHGQAQGQAQGRASMPSLFACPVITVAGTNGKGSTCAMLESIYSQAGFKTGVYSSPHLIDFEERCRINGHPVNSEALLPHFEQVEQARLHGAPISLSYFEFTTLVIFSLLRASQLDVVILEVGLGGRLDATNIVDADCAIITSIDLDHTELLGATREAIGLEKAGIMRTGKPVICSDPMPPASISEYAQNIQADLWLLGRDFHLGGDKQQWAWNTSQTRGRRQYHSLVYPALRGANQLINAAGVLAALEALRLQLPVTAQAIRNGLVFTELPGRFQIIPGEPALILDVAHNPHSVAALTANLDAMGYFPKTHAVFGAMADKDIATMLAKISPLIDCWYVCDLPTPRAARAHDLKNHIQTLLSNEKTEGKKRLLEPTISLHDSPQAALKEALKAADPTDRIAAFGSFLTVGGILQHGITGRTARHLPTATAHTKPLKPV